MGWLKKLMGFENSFTQNLVSDIFNDPTRLLTGIDPFSTAVWNGVTGTDNESLVNMFGSPGQRYYDIASKEGIDTGPASTFHQIADVVAGVFAANGLAGIGGSAPAATTADATLAGGGTTGTLGGTVGTTVGAGGIPQVIISGAAPATGGLTGAAPVLGGLAGIAAGTPPATQPTGDPAADQPGSNPDAPAGPIQTVNVPGTVPPAEPINPLIPAAVVGGLTGIGVAGGDPAVVTVGPPDGPTNKPIEEKPIDTPILPPIPIPFNPGVPDVNGGPGTGTPGTGAAPVGTTPGSNWLDQLGGLGGIIGGLGPLLGGYNDYKNSKDDTEWWKGQLDTLMGMYKPGTPEAELMRQKMEAKDAATGRRSQYGVRESELAANLAGKRSDIMTSAGYQNMANAYRNRSSQDLNGLFSAAGNQGTQKLISGLGSLIGNGIGSIFKP